MNDPSSNIDGTDRNLSDICIRDNQSIEISMNEISMKSKNNLSGSIRRYTDALQTPWAILIGIIAGVITGISNKPLAAAIAPGGTIFLSLLQMCVLPIMFAAVSSSLANLLISKEVGRNLGRILAIFSAVMFFSAGMGTLLGAAGEPGTRIDQKSRTILGKMLADANSKSGNKENSRFAPDAQVRLSDPLEPKSVSQPGVLKFIAFLIPTNIFYSLSRGENMQILIFAIVFGISLASIPSDLSENIIQGMSAIFKAFENVISWIMYLLPFGLWCLLAGQIAKTGFEIVISMTYFVIIIYVGSLFMIVVNTLLIKKMTGMSIMKVMMALRKTIIISFGTRNSFAAMPAALDAMSRELSMDEQTCNLVIPLGITMCRFGTVMAFALISIFFSQIYGITLTPIDYIVVIAGSVMAAIASAGTPGIVTLSMLSLIFTPLGLPLEAAITLMLAIDPIIDPIMTLVNVHTNCAATAAIAKNSM